MSSIVTNGLVNLVCLYIVIFPIIKLFLSKRENPIFRRVLMMMKLGDRYISMYKDLSIYGQIKSLLNMTLMRSMFLDRIVNF